MSEWKFKVPNNDEGKVFLKSLQKFKKKGLLITKRCRGDNRRSRRLRAGLSPSFTNDCPVSTADHFAIYINETTEVINNWQRHMEGFENE